MDLKNREIELLVNGIHKGVILTNIEKSQDIRYRMFVSLNTVGVTIEIIYQRMTLILTTLANMYFYPPRVPLIVLVYLRIFDQSKN